MAATAAVAVRVRQILSSLSADDRAKLRRAIPKDAFRCPEGLASTPYPAAVLALFPKATAYSALGILAEDLLRLPATAIDVGNLLKGMRVIHSAMTFGQAQVIKAHKTTGPFLATLAETRQRLDAALGTEVPLYNQVLESAMVQGHPDIITGTQVFEVKLTGLLERGWPDFIFQVFAYAALAPQTTRLHVVLPLQGRVWTYETHDWATRTAYLSILDKAAKKACSTAINDAVWGAALRAEYRIGHHISKQKTLAETVRSVPDPTRPYQIFLSGPMNSKVAVKDADIAAAAAMVAATGVQMYVHTPYLINLCAKTDGDWNRALLIKNVQIAVAAGCRGVVVHVGKSTQLPIAQAMQQMREAIGAAIEHATQECPVLLETPAGQGTETLTTPSEFLTFFTRHFKGDKRLRACVDTCHVFACGHDPLKYLEDMETAEPGLTKLVHYNDSAEPCGSCVDRHAFMGSGHIGPDRMTAIAGFCGATGLPMVIE
jgi:deoxyribonuclease-4